MLRRSNRVSAAGNTRAECDEMEPRAVPSHCPVSRQEPLAHSPPLSTKPSPPRAACDGPAGRLGTHPLQQHRHGWARKSGKEVNRLPRSSFSASAGNACRRPGRTRAIGEPWGSATKTASHNADPFVDEGRQGGHNFALESQECRSMTIDRLSARGSTEVGARQSHGCFEGKRECFSVTAIALSELNANSALCEVDAAQLRQGNPAVGADVADLSENHVEWRVPRRMRRRPDPYRDISAVGLEVQM